MIYRMGASYRHKATGQVMVLVACDLHNENYVDLTLDGKIKFALSWSGTISEFEEEWEIL